VWSWHPDAGVKLRKESREPNRAAMCDHPPSDGGKKARSPGRARYRLLKPLRGDAGCFRCLRCEYWCAYSATSAHTRLRVHWAPGIPRALCFARARDFRQDSGAMRGENENVRLRSVAKRPERANARAGCVPTIPHKRWARREMRLCATQRHCPVIASRQLHSMTTMSFQARYAAPPSTTALNTLRTSACVSLTRASSEEKSGASPARAITRSRSSPAVSGLKRSLTQSRTIWVRS
jgi:hypothetical protein